MCSWCLGVSFWVLFDPTFATGFECLDLSFDLSPVPSGPESASDSTAGPHGHPSPPGVFGDEDHGSDAGSSSTVLKLL